MSGDANTTGIGLIDVLDRVLDKGIVIDAAVRVSVVGIELLGVDARVVVASIQTYLKHADALAYTAMAAHPQPQRVEPPLFAEPLAEPTETDTIAPGTSVEPPLLAEGVDEPDTGASVEPALLAEGVDEPDTGASVEPPLLAEGVDEPDTGAAGQQGDEDKSRHPPGTGP